MARSKWKVPMSKAKPKEGHAHFVIAYKTAGGARMEFDGQLPVHAAQMLMAHTLDARRINETPTDGAL
jgi:hypothetical protein